MKNLIFILIHFLSVSYVVAQDKKEVTSEVDDIYPLIKEISMKLWDYSETALKEEKSAALLIKILQEEGFEIERNIAGMPTAFIASYGNSKPIIGILAEFDALPGVGNAAVPKKMVRSDSIMSGHGCGHNIFAAGSVGAAIAVKRVMDAHHIKGTIRLYGTPAEETVVGKVYMAREGVFDDLDAAFDWHPGPGTYVVNSTSLAMNNFTVEFFGQSAHGAADPWKGRSALDAVEMMNFGVNLMREHVEPTTRIHYVIPEGGKAPNVVPDYAKVWYFVRDLNREKVEKNYNRILKIAEGAALATETTHKVTLITGVHARLINRPLLELLQKNLELAGPISYSQEDVDWGKQMQRATGKEERGYDPTIKPLATKDKPVPVVNASTDVAEVSQIVPEAGFSVTTAPVGTPWHTWITSACHGTDAAVKGAVMASKVLALSTIDLLTDDKLITKAKQFFEKMKKGKEYQSPLHADQNVIIPE